MIVKARDKPILSMLEWTRVRLMSKLYTKKTDIEKYVANCVQAYKISWRR